MNVSLFPVIDICKIIFSPNRVFHWKRCIFFEEKIQAIRTELEAEENSSEHRPSYFVGETIRIFTRKWKPAKLWKKQTKRTASEWINKAE